ncbi:hypothetical protein TTRE_0000976701 [Trichuris trichiura]|uniref:Uncharacterized protein n=1 Tax=Trichuris trichiura TaxID=36087 RepID=A0A077ZLW1_TRITR|nr:hypothetical protein TTRE_0000976701 [Trichuris trichiura]
MRVRSSRRRNEYGEYNDVQRRPSDQANIRVLPLPLSNMQSGRKSGNLPEHFLDVSVMFTACIYA